MQNSEKTDKKPLAFNLRLDTGEQIKAAAVKEMGGNVSKWVQQEFDKLFAARSARDAE